MRRARKVMEIKVESIFTLHQISNSCRLRLAGTQLVSSPKDFESDPSRINVGMNKGTSFYNPSSVHTLSKKLV